MTEQGRYPKGEAPEDLDDNITLDANDDRWEWRRRIRSNPASHRAYRTVVAVLGLVVVVVGLIAVPAPGPGWLIVFIGVSIWASEFEWAQRLLYWGKARLRELGAVAPVEALVGERAGRPRHGRHRRRCVLGVPRVGGVAGLAARPVRGAARSPAGCRLSSHVGRRPGAQWTTFITRSAVVWPR